MRSISVLCNTVLVGTCRLQDGRQIEIVRNIPEPVNLLYDDLVNKDVIDHLLRDNISRDVASLQKTSACTLPCAAFFIDC